MAIEYGKVKYYDPKKHFGFLAVHDEAGNKTGLELFFHFDDGHMVGNDGETPVFDGKPFASDVRGESRFLDSPEKGDFLVFQVGINTRGRGGIKASPWGFADAWRKHSQWLSRRPVYRVICREKDAYARPDGTEEMKLVWKGQNHFELSAMHPMSYFDSYAATVVEDALNNRSFGDGHLARTYDFQVMRDGEWIACSDPRVILSCVPPDAFWKYAPEGTRRPRYNHDTQMRLSA